MCVVLTGIGIEVAMGADIGFVLITAGSVVIAGGAMIFARIVRRGRDRVSILELVRGSKGG